MNFRTTLLILFLLNSTLTTINAQQTTRQQKHKLRLANHYFKRTYFNSTIQIYNDLIANKILNYRIAKNLATAYYYTNQMDKSHKWFETVANRYKKNITEDDYYYYVQTLKALEKEKEANSIMLNYLTTEKTKEEVSVFKQNLRYLDNVKAIGDRYEIKNLEEINTKNSEFGLIRINDQLVFSSNKKETKLFEKNFKWDEQNYIDLYVAFIKKNELGEETIDSQTVELPGDINTKFHESNAVFTKDGKTMYFTTNLFSRAKRKRLVSRRIRHLQLYKAEINKNRWINIQPLPFNNSKYSLEHPALSTDEKTLYFSSDMKGGYGSFDLYSVDIVDGKFGKPKNLGPEINTNKREQFPFITKYNELYFSSNGHPGFGSLDIFISKLNRSGFEKPDNVGFPVNSGYDDFAFTIDASSLQGYFSSNRIGGFGSDDIYHLIETKPLIIEDCRQYISGNVKDKITLQNLENTKIVIKTIDNIAIDSIVTSDFSKYLFSVDCEKSYKIYASRYGYDNAEKLITVKKERNKQNIASFRLISDEELYTQNLFNAKERFEQLEQEKKEIAEAIKKQLENLYKEKGINLTFDKNIKKERGILMVDIEDIYFDFDKYYVRKRAKPVLNQIIKTLKKYPKMTIEIAVHSDNRGNTRYNLELSQKRANAIRNYILGKSRRIKSNRVFARGYGETRPIISCKNRSCTEEEYEINRRSEFVIKNY